MTLHTTLGDLKLEIHCDLVPRAAENFMALCASGYYNDTVFHRLIKGFMVQGGDPTGTGKGGTSIWGRKFPDEFDPTLQVCALCATLAPISLTLEQHNARGVVSMANSGPDTNGSQFFITFQKQPHLNQQYTIIGRYVPPRSPRSRFVLARTHNQLDLIDESAITVSSEVSTHWMPSSVFRQTPRTDHSQRFASSPSRSTPIRSLTSRAQAPSPKPNRIDPITCDDAAEDPSISSNLQHQ
mgnify:CR=1 FL=1